MVKAALHGAAQSAAARLRLSTHNPLPFGCLAIPLRRSGARASKP